MYDNIIPRYKWLVPNESSRSINHNIFQFHFDFNDNYLVDSIYLDFHLPEEFDSMVDQPTRSDIKYNILQHIETIIFGHSYTIFDAKSESEHVNTTDYIISSDFIKTYIDMWQSKISSVNRLCIPIPLLYFTRQKNLSDEYDCTNLTPYIKLQMSSAEYFYDTLDNLFGTILHDMLMTYFELLPINILMMIVKYIKYDLCIKLFYRETSYYDRNGIFSSPETTMYSHYYTYSITNNQDKIELTVSTNRLKNTSDLLFGPNYKKILPVNDPLELIINICDIYDYNTIIISGSNINIKSISIYEPLTEKYIGGTQMYYIDKDTAQLAQTSFKVAPSYYLLDVSNIFQYISNHSSSSTDLHIKFALPVTDNFNIYLFRL